MQLFLAINFLFVHFPIRKNRSNIAGAKLRFSAFIKKIFFGARRPSAVDDNLDKRLVYSLAPKKIPGANQLKYLKKTLSRKEILIIRALLVLILGNLVFVGVRFYLKHLQISAVRGGEYSEAIVGSPKTTNPLYTLGRDADSDLSYLIYSSLFKRDRFGRLKGDLSESWTVSPDNKSYTIVLRANAKWHTGDPVTADDVVFTFGAIKEADYKSPWRSVFAGVDIEKVDDRTVKFSLAEPYSEFLSLLTFGILPENFWSAIAPENAALADLNLKPVGSGPYRFKSYVKNQAGEIKEYDLIANHDYYEGSPYIEKLSFKFFPNYAEAVNGLNNNLVDGLAYLPVENKKDLISQNSLNFYKLPLTEVGAVFFNKKDNEALGETNVRQALALAIDKDRIVKEAFNGFAETAHGMLLPSMPGYDPEAIKQPYDLNAAQQLLATSSWQIAQVAQGDLDFLAASKAKGEKLSDPLWLLKQDIVDTASSSAISPLGAWRYKKSTKTGGDVSYLTVELTVPDSPEYAKTANIIKENWEALGVHVSIRTVVSERMDSDVIGPKSFEALLLVQALGHDADPFFFWHSSQGGEGGLNVSAFKNKEADSLLEAIRLDSKEEDRLAKLRKFQGIIGAETPAAFLYYPEYVYLQGKKVNGFSSAEISDPYDRFNNIAAWYVKTDRRLVW